MDTPEAVYLYTNITTRPVKITRFFELLQIIEDNNLWPEVQKYMGGKDLELPVRIQLDVLLLNAIKLALHSHDLKSPLNSDTVKSALFCSESIGRADRADRERERKAERARQDIERAQREEKERRDKGLPPH